jgi:hypothetical protein
MLSSFAEESFDDVSPTLTVALATRVQEWLWQVGYHGGGLRELACGREPERERSNGVRDRSQGLL